jgi:hypothetical protein
MLIAITLAKMAQKRKLTKRNHPRTATIGVLFEIGVPVEN